MSYLSGVDDELELVRSEIAAIRKSQEAQARSRHFATYATILGAIFAAGRLGILAVPFIKRSRSS